MPDSSNITGKICIVTGWGETQGNRSISCLDINAIDDHIKGYHSLYSHIIVLYVDTGDNRILQKAEVQIISHDVCTQWYKESNVEIPSNHLCAGYVFNPYVS